MTDSKANDKLALPAPTSIVTTSTPIVEEFVHPLHISDILKVCRNYAVLGYQIQNQADLLMEMGVYEAIEHGFISLAALPHIKEYFLSIAENLYFGEACDQALEYVLLIEEFEKEHPSLFVTKN